MDSKATKKVVDINGAAEYLAVHPQTVRRLAKQGRLGQKVGVLWRFKIDDLDRYVSNEVPSDSTNRGASNEQVQARNA